MKISADFKEIFHITSLHTAFLKELPRGYYFPGEYHNFWEIVLVLDGMLSATAGADVFTLQKGQAIIHEPLEFHRIKSDDKDESKIIIFTFGAKSMPELSSKIFEISDSDSAYKLLDDIQKSFEFSGIYVQPPRNISDTNYQTVIKKLEIFILETISKKIKQTDMEKPKAVENYALIVNILRNNLHRSFTISEIARLCSMSEINLKKTFSKYSGMGVMAYFNNMKITAAVDMIKNGISVQETADKLGFSSQNYFSTVFKRITGHNPSYYKQ